MNRQQSSPPSVKETLALVAFVLLVGWNLVATFLILLGLAFKSDGDMLGFGFLLLTLLSIFSGGFLMSHSRQRHALTVMGTLALATFITLTLIAMQN